MCSVRGKASGSIVVDTVIDRVFTNDVARINIIRWILPHLASESNVQPNDIMKLS